MSAPARAGAAPSAPVAAGGRLTWPAVIVAGGALTGIAAVTLGVMQEASRFHARNPVTGRTILLHRGHGPGARMPFDGAWALEGLRAAPLLAFAGVVVAAGLLLWALARAPEGRARRWPLATWIGLGAAGAIASALLPVSYALNIRLGDGATLPENIGRGQTFGAELLTSQLMGLSVQACAALGIHDAVTGIRVVDGACALVLAGSVAALADAATSTTRGRWLVLIGVLTSGASFQVMGYVETTVVELAAIALYMGAAAQILGAHRPGPLAAPTAWLGLGIAAMAHGAGALLLPSAALMVAPRLRPFAPAMQRHVTLFVTLVVMPFLFIVAPRWLADDLGNADGGGDHVRFVPADFDRVDPPSPVLYYGRFEALHWADLGNAMFVAAPLVPLLVLALPLAGRLARPSRLVRMLAVASAFAYVIPLLWNHDFGMWGDWNLASTYLFPVHLTGWVWLVQTLERCPTERRAASVIVASALTFQLTGLTALALQLY